MALGDFISGITNRLKGVTPPPQTPEGVSSVPTNPKVQGNPPTSQPEVTSEEKVAVKKPVSSETEEPTPKAETESPAVSPPTETESE